MVLKGSFQHKFQFKTFALPLQKQSLPRSQALAPADDADRDAARLGQDWWAAPCQSAQFAREECERSGRDGEGGQTQHGLSYSLREVHVSTCEARRVNSGNGGGSVTSGGLSH